MKRRIKMGIAALSIGAVVAAGMCAGATSAFAGAAKVADGTSWTVPTGQMPGGNTVTVNGKLYKVITTWANAWALSGPDYIGVSNSGSLNQQGGGGSTSSLSNAQNSTLLGIWASEANEVPNAYNWNYFWNLYCADQNYSSDRYADFQVVEVSNGAAANFTEGVYSPFKYRPEVIWTSNSLSAATTETYTQLIRDGKYYTSGTAYSAGDAADKSLYYINGDENYNPEIISAKNTTALTFVNSLYELAGISEDIEASTASYNANGAVTSSNVTWKTMNDLPRTTRYEASEENPMTARECALQDEKVTKGAVYYTLSKIADGTVQKKKVAFLTSNPDTTGDTATVAVFDTVDTIGGGADNGYAGVAPLTVTQLGEDKGTAEGTYKTLNTGSGFVTYEVSVDELATCDYIMLTSGGGTNGSSALTPETLKAWVADNASSAALKASAEKAQYATTAPAMMNAHNFTIEKTLFGIYNICFFYPELWPNMELLAFWYDNVYHVKSDSLKTAMQWGLGNVSLPNEVELANLGATYSQDDCDAKFQAGVQYYNAYANTDAVLKTFAGDTGRFTGATGADYSSCMPTSTMVEWAKNYVAPAADQKVTFSNVTKTFKVAKVKKAAQTFKLSASAKTAVTFAKKSGNAKITVAKNGKVTVKKGLAKGTYKVKVTATAKATKAYNAAAKTVTVTVKIK